MNNKNIKQYFTLKPKIEETKYIRFEYEEDRRKRLLNGLEPLSMSRFLTTLILQQLSGGVSNG